MVCLQYSLLPARAGQHSVMRVSERENEGQKGQTIEGSSGHTPTEGGSAVALGSIMFRTRSVRGQELLVLPDPPLLMLPKGYSRREGRGPVYK